MKKLFFIIMLPLIGLNIVLGQVKVEKYDALRLEKGMLYFYPVEIEKSNVFTVDSLFGCLQIEEIMIKESDFILYFDSITTSDTTNACQIHKIFLETNDTITLIYQKDWSKWLDKLIKKEELTRIGSFFFKDSYKESGYMYFFDFPKGYRLSKDPYSGSSFNLYIDEVWLKFYFGPTLNEMDIVTKKKWVSGFDIGHDEIQKKSWLKKLSKFDWNMSGQKK